MFDISFDYFYWYAWNVFCRIYCYGVIPYAAPMMIAPINPVLAVINILVLPVTTALAEDGLYLGGGVNSIKNKYLAIFIPAFSLLYSTALFLH